MKYDSLPSDQGGEFPISETQIKPHSEYATINMKQNNLKKKKTPQTKEMEK